MDEDAYLSQFRPHLMDVVYTWANGATFSQICKMTDVFEGDYFFFNPPPMIVMLTRAWISYIWICFVLHSDVFLAANESRVVLIQ